MAAPSFTGSECDNTNDGKESDEDYGDDLHRGADYLRVLAHESQEGLAAVPTIPGLAEPLAFALSPVVISAPCVGADPFTVEFTQQLSSCCAADPALALSHVFQRCLACDLMSVLSGPLPRVFFLCPIRNTLRCGGYLFAWPSMHVTMLSGCLLFDEHEGDFGVCRHLRESLRRRIEAKLRGVCPLHLSRQLRGTPDAQSEWMDAAQLGRPVFFSLRCRGNRESTASLPAAFYCWGSTVLKLPV
ncbi:hypothetical protein TcCL_Unassigned02174 [Trypanosoma cruzi]|nr:hypothetical protein TcCL_Unassigned02174 [Trypanosoma cruzi]